MFHLYQHHDLEALASLISVLRQRAAPKSPLTADTMVVANRGMARWLQSRLASDEGIAANLALPVPGRFVWDTLRDTLPGEPDSTDYERERLTWHLYALLPELKVTAVQRYLAAEPRERYRYQLATALADVFDAYLIHRRDILADWEAGRESSQSPADWQAPVWRALVQRLGARHRAALMTEFLAAADGGTIASANLPDPIYALALSDLPPDYLRLFHALSHYVDVHFLLPNPSATYWGDTSRQALAGGDGPSAHPLLSAFGRAGRDLLRVVYSDEFPAVHEPDLGEALAPQPPNGDELLQRVQRSVIEGEPAVDETGIAADDPSLQVHSCHGPWREMQVLQDRLLDLLSRWDHLEPRDVLVMVPNIAGYAPAIHSVFGAADADRYLPYRVTNTPRRDRHPIVHTFQHLIELPLSRWTASEVLALAAVPAVRRAFELADADLEQLRHWVPAAGVRWGLDGADRAANSAGFEQNSWQFGLDRLLLGLSQSDDLALVDGVAPWSDLEGGPATAIGRLWHLIDRLRTWRDRLNEAATAPAWQNRLNAMADDLFAVDSDAPTEAAALNTVRDAVAILEGADASLHHETLSWEAVREALLGALAGSGQRQPLVSGGITFTGIEALRGVPYTVIAMVGMDDGAFPRQDGQREFSLLQKYPRTGDPSVRDTDRLTFLQSLMSARRCFYISYTGRNRIDGEALKPSPAVGELLDYLHTWHFSGWPRHAFEQALVTEEPMHPFSPAYFQGKQGLFTYDGDWRAAAVAQQGERTRAPPLSDDSRLDSETATPLDLAGLIAFFRHPPQWFFREALGLVLADETDPPDDAEPRVLDGLAQHGLRERLWDQALRLGWRELLREPDALERARGQLPPAPLGGAAYAQAADTVNQLLPLYWRWREEHTSVAIDCRLDDGTRIMGRVTELGGTAMRRLRPGPLRAKQLLPWWLAYLALVAQGDERVLEVAGSGEDGLDTRRAHLAPHTARRYLGEAVAWFREGLARPLLFEPYVAEHYLAQRAKTDKTTGDHTTPDAALRSTNGWLSNQWQPPHAARDPWLLPLFTEGREPLGATAADSDLATMAEAILVPLRTHLQAVEAPA